MHLSTTVLCLLPALLGACGVAQPSLPLERFAQGDLGVVADAARREATEGPVENQALVLNVLAQCELLQGDLDAAWRHFGQAARIMGNWAVSGSQEFAAIVGTESSKDWTGDPYEKAMNAYYLGLCFLLRGEPDNARAAFKKGILADGESSEEQDIRFREDFTVLFWLAGRMSRLMGLPADAEDLFREAAEADQFARAHGSRGTVPNPVLDDPGAGNLVVLVDIGLGPEKYAAGDEEELARFRRRAQSAERAQVWIDGELRGPTYLLTDVDYQARTRGGTEMEGIRQGKAVLKQVTRAAGVGALVLAENDRGKGRRDKAIAGVGLLLLSSLTSTAADVRYWPTLPSSVQALCLDVAPGDHELRVDFLTATGRVVTGLSQTWTVSVPADGESYYLFRSLPNLDRIPRPTP